MTGDRRVRCVALLMTVLGAASLSACGGTAGGSPPTSTATTSAAAHAARHRTRRARAQHRGRRAGHRRTAGGRPARAGRGVLAFSSASASTVQSQPPPGACHPAGSGLDERPDPRCTPGALNPEVTQGTIDRTICVSGWTAVVRPSVSVTDPEKVSSMAAYGDGTDEGAYEYDHLVPLELGGAVNDPRNLWPEPGASPNPKDSVENALRRLVCDGRISLARAQSIMATDWTAWARRPATVTSPRPAATPKPPPQTGVAKPIAEVNCSDFTTHAAAQQWFTAHGGSAGNDVAGLDADHDGVACESLS